MNKTLSAFKSMTQNAVIKCVMPNNKNDDVDFNALCDSMTDLNLPNNIIGFDDGYIFSWLTNQADLVIAITENSGDCLPEQEFLYHANQNDIIADRFDKVDPTYTFWTEKSLFEIYRDDSLKNYLYYILKLDDDSFPEGKENRNIFARRLIFGNWYRNFMRKHKATVDTSVPYISDNMADEKYQLKSLGAESEYVRKFLLETFYLYDSSANEYSSKYHSSIYVRAVMPFIITIAIAIGFYAETLLSPWPISIADKFNLWSIIAGIGFFVHALLNLYVFKLSEDTTVKSWHEKFVNSRFLAESLRLSLHFAPFGIPTDFKNILDKNIFKMKRSRNTLNKLRSINRTIGIPGISFNKNIIQECIETMESLITDQIAYHERSVKRYETICRKLKLFGNVVFYAGFIIVLLRGCLQLYISVFGISGTFHGIPLTNLIKSLANMLALLAPAWAGYFSSKLALCNFDYILSNHQMMVSRLSDIKLAINDEKQINSQTYCEIDGLSKKISSVILGESESWYSHISSKKITKI